MNDVQVSDLPVQDVLGADFVAGRDELLQLFRQGVQEAIAQQFALGRPVYSSGLGAEAGKLFMRTADGRRFEYRVREDGAREVVRELNP